METKIAILDFYTGTVYVDYYPEEYEWFSDFLEYFNSKHGLELKESECLWMKSIDLKIISFANDESINDKVVKDLP